jgi:hypothetical protein
MEFLFQDVGLQSIRVARALHNRTAWGAFASHEECIAISADAPSDMRAEVV